MDLNPLYTTDNCNFAYQLNWAISLFGNHTFPAITNWIEPVKSILEQDDVRILEYRLISARVLAFLISTKPHVNPARLLQVLKGRLQYAGRSEAGKVFRRNYRIESVGSAKRSVIERYVATQYQRHPMADFRVQQKLADLQIKCPEVDLSRIRYSAHGQFIYNLHIVIEHQDSGGDTSNEFLCRTIQMIQRVATKKELLLKGAGIVANHLHLAIGCGLKQSPSEIALCFLNNLAAIHGMQPIYKFGFYAGTFCDFDLGAIWNASAAAIL